VASSYRFLSPLEVASAPGSTLQDPLGVCASKLQRVVWLGTAKSRPSRWQMELINPSVLRRPGETWSPR
jgi:hypothetical protein